jgi:hypothetical protein
MKKLLSAAMAAIVAATSIVAFTGDADARRRDRYYDRHHYNDNYRYRHHHNNNDELAAGIVGFALGAIVAGTANNYARRNSYYVRDPGWEHIRRCEATYRSYDRYSNTFIGYDGRRYYCNL